MQNSYKLFQNSMSCSPNQRCPLEVYDSRQSQDLLQKFVISWRNLWSNVRLLVEIYRFLNNYEYICWVAYSNHWHRIGIQSSSSFRNLRFPYKTCDFLRKYAISLSNPRCPLVILDFFTKSMVYFRNPRFPYQADDLLQKSRISLPNRRFLLEI